MIVTLEEDPETGDLILPLPEELLKETGWKTGDVLEWIDNNDGTYTLRKKAMPKFTLIADHSANGIVGDSKITYEFHKEYLGDILQEFEQFLRGCGFVFDGVLDFVEEDVFSVPEKQYDFEPLQAAVAAWPFASETTPGIKPEDIHDESYFDTERNK
jgi:bifunctional DNA-binding transcriptional regulator/antitoxin component of YhaV-PrlF toxin-antitoxin module